MKRVSEMLKARHLFAALLLMSVAPACTDSNEEEVKPTPETKLELSIEIGKVTESSIKAAITPSDKEATYYAGIHTEAEVGNDSAAALVEQLVAAPDFASKLIRGTQTISATELEAETRYYVVAFGYDPDKQKLTGDVALKSATTEAIPEPEFPYTIELALQEGSATWRDAVILVKPSSDEANWICDICSKELYDSRYAGNPAAIIEDNIEVWRGDALTFDGDPENWAYYMKNYWRTGEQAVAASEIRNLRWSEDYYVYCFATNEQGEQTSEIVAIPFSTSTPNPSSNEISITINLTDKSTVDFTVETTNEDPYFVSIQTTDYLARFGEGKEETMEDMIYDLSYSKTEEQLQATVFNGTVNLTNADLNKTVNGFKEYQVVVWGYDNGPTTEVFLSEPFQPGTTHQPLPEEAFEVTISEPTWCNALVDITLLADTKYIWGGFTKEVWEENYASNLQAVYDYNKSGWERDASSYGGSWLDQIKYYINSGNKSGEDATNIIGASRLAWGTEYVIYLFGIDETTGEMTTEVEYFAFSTLAPTPSTNTFTITIDAMTRSSVEFTITPTTDEPYYVTIEKKSSVESWGDEVIKKTIPEYDNQLEQRTFTGTQTLTQSDLGKTVNGFSEYYIIVYGFENGPTTEVTLSEAFKPAD